MKLIAMIIDAAEDDIYYFTRTLEMRIGLSTSLMTMLLPSRKNWLIFYFRLNFHGLSCFPPHGGCWEAQGKFTTPVVQT